MNVEGFYALTEISQGSYSRVCSAKTRDSREAILKILKGGSRLREVMGLQEYRILCLLQEHKVEHVVRAVGLHRSSLGELVLELQFFKGETLASLVRNEYQWSLDDFVKLAIGLVKTLAAIHKLQLIHHDLTSSNVMYDKTSGDFCILDFGLSCIISSDESPMTTPQGTLPFMSCEQMGRISDLVDHRTDLYSLGVIFYHLLTGTLPFPQTDPLELTHAILAVEPVMPHLLNPSLPRILSSLIMKMMSKNPEDRYQSAVGLMFDLQRIQGQLSSNYIVEFPLAIHDVASLKRLSRLYGRDEEIEDCVSQFEQNMTSQRPTVRWIYGSSGIGKSILVRTIHEKIRKRYPEARLVNAKLSQFQNVPFACFKLILQELLQMILSQSSSVVQHWKSKIEEAVGANGDLLISMFPLLEAVIGPQPPVPALPAKESSTSTLR